MNIISDIIFGLVLPYFVLPALLIFTIVKMRSLKLTLALLALVVAAFCYGLAMGIQMEKRENHQRQHSTDIQAQQERSNTDNQPLRDAADSSNSPQSEK